MRLHNLRQAAAFALAAALALPVSLLPATASADENADQCSEQDSSAPGKGNKKRRLRTKKRADGTIEVLDTFIVCGKVPRPAALYVLSRTTINYEWETARPNFLKRVSESLTKSPF